MVFYGVLYFGIPVPDDQLVWYYPPQMVSMSRRRLYAKAFGKEPEDLKDVDEWIMGI